MKTSFKVIIPARKNSKRLTSKNSKVLCGKPLISYSLDFAIKYFEKSDIWVNTDDEKIVKIAKKYNINIYNRDPRLALDKSSISQVIVDHCKYFIKNKISFDHIILLQPTNPFRSDINLKEILNYYLNNNIRSLMTVTEINKKFGKINGSKFEPVNYQFEQRSQSIESYYYENGALYICQKSIIENEKMIISADVYPYIVNGNGLNIDIDYQEDFDRAELYLKSKHLLK
tara:strand:- start:746 stop:1432 length:687 start_codon:yes stop_codon:yes gene_type:complete